jgi:hypothetical protein
MFSKKCKFQIVLKIHNLSNLPYLSGLYYAKYKLARLKGSTAKVPVKNHVVIWNQEVVLETNINVGRDGVLQNSDLLISIKQSLLEGNTEKIGIVCLNLSEFAGQRMVTRRVLLRDSNVNCILSITVDMKLLKGDPGFLVPRSTIEDVLELDQDSIKKKNMDLPLVVDLNDTMDGVSAIVSEIFANSSKSSTYKSVSKGS